MNKLSDVELRVLDSKLFDYQQIDRKIAIRKLEIQTETSNDCNIGGGKANTISKPTENVIARWSSDVRINGLEQLRSAIESTLDALDDELKKVFYLRWSRGSVNTWEEIADMLHVSRKSIYRKRERILTIFADFRGDS
jgi:RinA family phage transcriptional activator